MTEYAKIIEWHPAPLKRPRRKPRKQARCRRYGPWLALSIRFMRAVRTWLQGPKRPHDVLVEIGMRECFLSEADAEILYEVFHRAQEGA